MLSLDASSHCDVCCESFSSLPECIDCGHIFCSNCLDAICEKTWSPRQLPACPFCREPFTKDSVRKIRVELKTPRRPAKELESDYEESDSSFSNPSEAKQLEEKVAKAAANKCSFEEVSELHKEIQSWLKSEVKRASAAQHASLQLSAALLKAILLNCLAYSEASKAAKNVEANLRERLETVTLDKDQLDAEVRKYRLQYTQKVRECQELRSEVNRLKLTSPGPGGNGVRSLAIGLPPRNTSSPSPLSRPTSVRNVSAPVPQQFQRASYLSRPSSTGPTVSNTNGYGRGFYVGSAPTSNTMASALKSRAVSSWSAPPPEDEKPHERWLPVTSDNESLASEKQFSFAPADRLFSNASSHQKWMPQHQTPPLSV